MVPLEKPPGFQRLIVICCCDRRASSGWFASGVVLLWGGTLQRTRCVEGAREMALWSQAFSRPCKTNSKFSRYQGLRLWEKEMVLAVLAAVPGQG